MDAKHKTYFANIKISFTEVRLRLQTIHICWLVIGHPPLAPVCEGIGSCGAGGVKQTRRKPQCRRCLHSTSSCPEIARAAAGDSQPARQLIGLQERCEHLTVRRLFSCSFRSAHFLVLTCRFCYHMKDRRQILTWTPTADDSLQLQWTEKVMPDYRERQSRLECWVGSRERSWESI